ncbi:ornithine carbamoyltransferase [Streptomyces sp. NPDC056347]|uniref:ornithine carbamoyltransferase n=1 Tax=Streptomyces sp. NPDC056347 TaxID=3345790 RepID=UPI0035DFAE54
MRHLISLTDLTDSELRRIAHRGAELSARPTPRPTPLDGQIVGVYFAKTSTRTRTAFSSGALRLGGSLIAYGPGDLQLNTGESTEDTGRVLSGMLDVLVARTAGPEAELRGWARQNTMSVINAMTAEEHPTQALTDLTTLLRHFGRIDGLRILYAGEGNNTAAALALALTRFPGVRFDVRTPPGYGLAAPIAHRARAQAARTGAVLAERHDMNDLDGHYDVIYTTRWQTTGTSKPDPRWRDTFAPFQVTTALWETSPNAVFMHDLPAHRGEEVTAEVLDGPHSIAFAQATNKMHSAMAALEFVRTTPAPATPPARQDRTPVAAR